MRSEQSLSEQHVKIVKQKNCKSTILPILDRFAMYACAISLYWVGFGTILRYRTQFEFYVFDVFLLLSGEMFVEYWLLEA